MYVNVTTLYRRNCNLIGADEVPGPVKWTRPYFDCGRANKWLVAAVVPIADIYPRHTSFRHIEYPTYVVICFKFAYQ